jgi:hypothetical protein
MLLFVCELIKGTNDVRLRIRAHMLAIAREGINPQTTPIAQKHRLYRRFQIALIIGAFELLIYLTLVLLIKLAFVADEVATDFIIVTMVAMLCWLFRLKAEPHETYTRIPDEDADAQEIQLADIENIDLASDQMTGGREWEQGMRLPGQPTIVATEQQVVLASPDGTETLEAKGDV